MMINYGKFTFASPPRTGTAWFIRACDVAGLGDGDQITHEHRHIPHSPTHGGFALSIIRHPYEWLESYYHAIRGVAVGVPCVDVFSPLAKEAENFEAFAVQYLRDMPGAVSDMFIAYNASSVMRLEELRWATQELFRSVGVEGDELRDVSELPPENVRTYRTHVKHPRLRREVCDADGEFCERYDYSRWEV